MSSCGQNFFKLELQSSGINYGALAQLARAPALQAGGPGFESLTLHQYIMRQTEGFSHHAVRRNKSVETGCSFPIWGELGLCLAHSTIKQGAIAQLVRARH